MPFLSDEPLMTYSWKLYLETSSPDASRRASSIFLPFSISPTENGDSQSKLTMLFCEPLGRRSRLGHFCMSRYQPTVVMFLPGDKHIVSPYAVR